MFGTGIVVWFMERPIAQILLIVGFEALLLAGFFAWVFKDGWQGRSGW